MGGFNRFAHSAGPGLLVESRGGVGGRVAFGGPFCEDASLILDILKHSGDHFGDDVGADHDRNPSIL